MIFSFVLIILSVLIQLFAGLLGVLGWSFPAPIISAIQVFFNVLHVFSSFLPFIGDIVAIFLVLVPVYVIRYVFAIILWLWSLVPFIGSHTSIPTIPALDLRGHNNDRNVLDLREGRHKSPSKKTMRDIR